jgi:uncharacterized protein YbjT (DUF2867 family)
MKLTVFAATGGIDRQLVEQALAAGHEVTAVVRNPGAVSDPVRVSAAPVSTLSLPGRPGSPTAR